MDNEIRTWIESQIGYYNRAFAIYLRNAELTDREDMMDWAQTKVATFQSILNKMNEIENNHYDEMAKEYGYYSQFA